MDRDYAVAGQASAQNYGAEAIYQKAAYSQMQSASPTLLAEFAMRIQDIRDNLGPAFADLTMLRDRVFGSEPEAPSAMRGANAPMPPGLSSELTAQLENLKAQAVDLASLARALNARI